MTCHACAVSSRQSAAQRAASSTSSEDLADLATHRFATVRRAVASNSATPDEVVAILAADSDELVRLNAAASAQYRPAIHGDLSRSSDRWVRAVLADVYAATPGRALTYEVQRQLAQDEISEVRMRIAMHTEFLDLFERLLGDESPKVRGSCACNPRATREHIETCIVDRAWQVRAAAAANGVPYPDADQLIRLAQDRSAQVRWAVLVRPDAPRAAVAIIAGDADDMNRHHADLILAGVDVAGAQPRAFRQRERAQAALLAFAAPPSTGPLSEATQRLRLT